MPNPLQPKPVPPPVPQAGTIPPDQLPGQGRPPLRTGEVRVSDYTRRQLESVGWKDGDPIPGDLGARLKEMQAEVQRERADAKLEDSELAVGWKPVNASFVSIEDLPVEQQEEIREYLAEYKQQVAAEEQAVKNEADVESRIPPNVQGPQRQVMKETIMQGEAAAKAREQRINAQESVVLDDRQTASAPPPEFEVPEGKQYGGMLGNTGVADKISALNAAQAAAAAPPPKPAPAPEPEPAPESMSHGKGPCPRCSWPTEKPFELDITEQDKQKFLIATLGMGRFEKRYSLLGGNMFIYFHSLTTNESEMLQQQLGAMLRSGAIIGDTEYWAHVMEFRLAMSVSKIEMGGNVTYSMPGLAEWAASQTAETLHPTPIPMLRDYLYDTGITQEPLRRVAGQRHQQFQRLTEALEAMTGDENFWTGIELHG